MVDAAWPKNEQPKRKRRSLRVRRIGGTHSNLRSAASMLSGFWSLFSCLD
jgi:hypothetical protein